VGRRGAVVEVEDTLPGDGLGVGAVVGAAAAAAAGDFNAEGSGAAGGQRPGADTDQIRLAVHDRERNFGLHAATAGVVVASEQRRVVDRTRAAVVRGD